MEEQHKIYLFHLRTDLASDLKSVQRERENLGHGLLPIHNMNKLMSVYIRKVFHLYVFIQLLYF